MTDQVAVAEPARMECMEIFGSNRTSRRLIQGHGITLWLDCLELGGESGGDIHYISTCGSGELSRTILADVAGHGSEVDAVAKRLRDLMRKYINTFDQTTFARSLNEAMVADSQSNRFATALLLTYFNPTHHLVVCNAGHLRPLWYSTRNGGWQWLDEHTPDVGQSLRQSRVTYHLRSIANIPLGILEPADYSQFAVQLAAGDLVVLYTDGVIEAPNAAGEQYGAERLFAAAEKIGPRAAGDFGPALIEQLQAWQGTHPAEDDRTLIVLEHTATRSPAITPVHSVKTLLKMLGLWKV